MNRTTSRLSRWALLASLTAAPVLGAASTGIEIHEWGTFTSLQYEDGHAVGRINTDDEPVPSFVHEALPGLLFGSAEPPHRDDNGGKGAPRGLSAVTMRLETPVLYVHTSERGPIRLDVSVAFRGGWLTQFYPDAEVLLPGLVERGALPPLTAETLGKLTWKGVVVNGGGTAPSTDDPVWLAPRRADAATLSRDGEAERFLFYRGVGHLDAPLEVVREGTGPESTLEVLARPAALGGPGGIASLGRLWFLDLRPDGTAGTAVLDVPSRLHERAGGRVSLGAIAVDLPRVESTAAVLGSLRREMLDALIENGLYPDEAEALLETWELSYFRSPGLRMFFLVPRTWTERVLPLSVSGSPRVARVMVGRIELIAPWQRERLARIAAGRVPTVEEASVELARYRAAAASGHGSSRLPGEAAGPSSVFGDYLDLGRFRDALVWDEDRRRPGTGLRRFIEAFMLEYRKPPTPSTSSSSTHR